VPATTTVVKEPVVVYGAGFIGTQVGPTIRVAPLHPLAVQHDARRLLVHVEGLDLATDAVGRWCRPGRWSGATVVMRHAHTAVWA